MQHIRNSLCQHVECCLHCTCSIEQSTKIKEILTCHPLSSILKYFSMKEKNMLRQNKNKIICFFIALLLAAVTIYAVFQGGGVSFHALWARLKEASWQGIVLAVISMLGFIYFEGEAIRVIVCHMGYSVKRNRGFIYAAADVYFSAITPSASGGQPASAWFMIQDGIPGTAVMTALLLNLIMYTLAILTIGLLDIFFFPGVFLHFSIGCRVLILIGGLVLAGLAVLFFLLLKKQNIVKALGLFLITLLTRLHLKRLAHRLEKRLDASIDKYSQCASLVLNGKTMLLKAYLFNLLQRLSQIIVTLFTFAAMHGDWRRLPELLATQIYVVLGSNCVPIPGGVGVTDYLMLQGYKQLMDRGSAYQLEILSRGLSFYVCIFVSLITVCIGYIVCTRNKTRERKE